MAVGATNTKGGDARIAYFVLPRLCRHRYGKRALFKLKRRVGRVKMQHWRDLAAAYRQNGFQQSGNTRCGIQVAHVTFHGTQRTALLLRTWRVDVA